MKTAILSDIHGNREALSVILDSVKKSGAESMIILGDIIDYGPHSETAHSADGDFLPAEMPEKHTYIFIIQDDIKKSYSSRMICCISCVCIYYSHYKPPVFV